MNGMDIARSAMMIGAGAILALISGCATSHKSAATLDALSRRAAFELGCDDQPDKVRVEVFEQSQGYYPVQPLAVGVTACGGRITYVRQPGRAGWATSSLTRRPSRAQ